MQHSHLSAQDAILSARAELETALALVGLEIRTYPAPISGCDAQYNYLLGMRGALRDALAAVDEPHFVPTPRQPDAMSMIEQR